MEKQEDNRDLIRLFIFHTFFQTKYVQNEELSQNSFIFSKNFSFSYCRFRKNAYLCNRNRER